MDRISTLPDNAIELILDRLQVIDKVRTSALSKFWRFRWTYLPSLVLDEKFYLSVNASGGQGPPVLEYLNIIHSLLLQHNGHLQNFTLYIPYDRPSDKVRFDNVVRFVSRIHGLQGLSILNKSQSNPYSFPCNIFSLVHLTHLELFNCQFPYTVSLGEFPNLLSLVMKSCTLTADRISYLVSSCPRLQVINFDKFGDEPLDLTAPELKCFTFIGRFKTICIRSAENLDMVDIKLFGVPDAVEVKSSISAELFQFFQQTVKLREITLALFISEKMWKLCGALRKLPVYNLVKLLQFDVILHDLDALQCVLRFCSCSPNLEELKLGMVPQDIHALIPKVAEVADLSKYVPIVDKYLSCDFGRLKRIWFHRISGSIVHMKMIELFLRKSPILEEMIIRFPSVPVHKEQCMLVQMLSFCRISPKAKITFVGRKSYII